MSFKLLPSAVTAVMLLSAGIAAAQAPASGQVLWYRQPAPIWDNALPVGNGRLGAMIFGGANTGDNNGDLQDVKKNAELMDGHLTSGADEHLQLNEATVWQGSRADRLNPKAREGVQEIRKLLLESKGLDGAKIAAAENLAKDDMLAVPVRMPGYTTLGDLYLRAKGKTSVSDYRRQLDLATGVAKTTYTAGGIHYTREMFASAPDHVIVMRISADRRAAISFRMSMDRPADFAVRTAGLVGEAKDRLILREGAEHKDQIRFAAEALVLPEYGSVSATDNELAVDGADSVVILIAAATNFKGGPFAGGDPEEQCQRVLAAARRLSYQVLLKAHIVDQQSFLERMELRLGPAADPLASLPTDERVRRVAAGGDDLHLQELYFQFARYLLVSCSRADSLPANLQGMWAAGISNLGLQVHDQREHGDELLARRARRVERHDCPALQLD